MSSRVCPLDSANARLHLFCHLLLRLPWSLLLLSSTTKKNTFRICTFPCIIYCHKNVNCSFFLKGGSPPFSKNRENPENQTFLWTKKCVLMIYFCFPAWNSHWQVRFAKNHIRFGQFVTMSHLFGNFLSSFGPHYMMIIIQVSIFASSEKSKVSN